MLKGHGRGAGQDSPAKQGRPKSVRQSEKKLKAVEKTKYAADEKNRVKTTIIVRLRFFP